MEEWKEYKLSDIVEINPTESLKKGTVTKKIGMDVLQPYCRAIPSFSFEPYTGGTKFKNGDTIMARITPCLENGKTAMVNILDENEIGFGSTEYIVFRAKNKITDPYFVYYFVASDCIRNPAIKSMVGSSGRQRVQTDVVANLSVKLPSLPTRQKIAAILSSLDDKIELNNKININLEQQAQALFKNWFVDFEPFGGKMPEGWKVGKLSNVSILSAGGDRPKDFSNEPTEDLNIPIYSNGLDNFGLYGYTNKAKIFEESVTVSARGTIGFVCLRMEPYVPIVRLISLIPNKDNMSAKYLYLHLLNSNISGTGTTQQQLTVPAFSKEAILIPPKKKLMNLLIL